jgi:hypothetical protein
MLQNGAQRLRAEKKHMQQHLHSGRSAAWFGNVAPGLCGIEPVAARGPHTLYAADVGGGACGRVHGCGSWDP